VTDIDTTVDAYVALRDQIEAGQKTWTDLCQFFTDDMVYIDPAWGRVEGLDNVREFMIESMVGLEDWKFPVEVAMTNGDLAIVKWDQVSPGQRADGSPFVQSGISTMVYAGDGKFSYEEDVLNMAHVLEDLAESGWRPGAGFNAPPAHPNRDWSKPGR
jgi:ketosteroid isomerase-like protein